MDNLNSTSGNEETETRKDIRTDETAPADDVTDLTMEDAEDKPESDSIPLVL